QNLPKDKDSGSGGSGWMELGNWYRYGWRTADAEAKRVQSPKSTVQSLKNSNAVDAVSFSFRPVNTGEFPKVKNYPATFRYTFKIRVTSIEPLPEIARIEAFTDSIWEQCAVRLAWDKAARISLDAFNGAVEQLDKVSARNFRA